MKIIVAYDIADPRRIYRVAKILTDYGMRVQKSIFEVDVNANLFKEMRKRVSKEIVKEEDGVKYFPLCERCREALEILGQGEFLENTPSHKVI